MPSTTLQAQLDRVNDINAATPGAPFSIHLWADRDGDGWTIEHRDGYGVTYTTHRATLREVAAYLDGYAAGIHATGRRIVIPLYRHTSATEVADILDDLRRIGIDDTYVIA